MRIYFYIAKKFWGPFLFALGVFTTLVVLGDTFEKMKNLGNGTTTILDLLSYSVATFPNWLATIMPGVFAGGNFGHFRNGGKRRMDGLRGGRICAKTAV